MTSRILLGFVSIAFAANISAQVAVVNAASFRAAQPVAPGSIGSAFGTFTGVVQTSASAIPLPTTLGGARVFVDAIEAPLFYASNSQINFQVPGSLGPGTHQIRVVVSGAGEYSGSFIVMDSAPGVFTVFSSGDPARAAVVNQNGTTNAEDSPAPRNSYISVYATGPGPLTQSIGDGEVAPSDPLIQTVSNPKVYIAGVEAEVTFSGLAPTFAGLWQINVRVPDMPFVSGRVPMQLFMDGVDSNEVSIFVAQ